MLAHARKH
jgi:hypothetical protein